MFIAGITLTLCLAAIVEYKSREVYKALINTDFIFMTRKEKKRKERSCTTAQAYKYI